jgi:hypothetical protein
VKVILNCTLCPAPSVIGKDRSLRLNSGACGYSLESVIAVEPVLINLADRVAVFPTGTPPNQSSQGLQLKLFVAVLPGCQGLRCPPPCARLTWQVKRNAKNIAKNIAKNREKEGVWLNRGKAMAVSLQLS